MSARLAALCVRAAAPPPEGGAPANDAAARAVTEAATAVGRLVERLEDADVRLTLGMAPAVAAALPGETVRALGALATDGALELCLLGATDAWLPALGAAGRRAQVGVAHAEHRRRFGIPPRGFWPRDLAVPRGLEAHLGPFDLRWTLTSHRALALGRPAPPAEAATPVVLPGGLAAFGAHRLAESRKAPPPATFDGRPPLETIALDIGDLDAALTRLARGGAETTTPSRYLHRYPRNPACRPAPLAGADDVARGPYVETVGAAMIRHLRATEIAVARHVALAAARRDRPEPLRQRTLRQAVREALLCACADWPGLGDYGAARFRAHAARGHELAAALAGTAPLDAAYLGEIEARDGRLFEEIEAEWLGA